jgi:phasin family protein
MVQGLDDLQNLSRDGMDKAMSSLGALSKGVQALATEMSESSKKTLEANSAFVQDLLGARTLDRAVELQTDFAKRSYERFIAQTTKFNELVVDMTKNAARPFEVAPVRK